MPGYAMPHRCVIIHRCVIPGGSAGEEDDALEFAVVEEIVE